MTQTQGTRKTWLLGPSHPKSQPSDLEQVSLSMKDKNALKNSTHAFIMCQALFKAFYNPWQPYEVGTVLLLFPFNRYDNQGKNKLNNLLKTPEQLSARARMKHSRQPDLRALHTSLHCHSEKNKNVPLSTRKLLCKSNRQTSNPGLSSVTLIGQVYPLN